GGTVQLSPGRSFDAVPLEGGAGDINRTVGFVAAIRTRWCNRPRVSIAYCSPILTVDVVKMQDEEYMLEQLRADAPNSSHYGCAINKFAGGVVFNQFDTTAGKLDYTILIPTEFLDDPWHLDQLWDDPFGANNDYNRPHHRT
ncbi:hypothetical protein TELCIR_23070, partial [Teladorsagia circumcincta]